MQEVTFDLQTTTPLFMSGADYHPIHIPEKKRQGKKHFAEEGGDLQPEMRPPSFRGLMRYWLRAAVGGLINTITISFNDVIQFEQNVFGTTDHYSAITVRTTNISKVIERFKKDGYSRETVTGSDYLLWSMAESGKGEDYKPHRLYFPVGTHFKITLSERSSAPATPQKLPFAIASLWLLTHLGGIGSRSRRCAGSLTVLQATKNTTNIPFATATNKEELQAILHQGITEIYKLFVAYSQSLKKHNGDMPLKNAPFDCLSLLYTHDHISSPHSCRIWILTQNNGIPWQSLKDAIDNVGLKLQTYRSYLSSLERATFGLPLHMRLSAQERELEEALKENRRASPLLLRITKLRSGYVCVAVLFKTPFSPIINPCNKRILIPTPDYTLIENWITTSFPKALEVRL